MVYTCKWGILATGGIAEKFTRDLLIDPTTREVADVKHEVVAVASSTSLDRARTFVSDLGLDLDRTRSYDSYENLVADKGVDIVYIATPHSHHYENAKLCLKTGKSVLCEKPFTINAQQTIQLTQLAKEKGLFLMEAVWTRFFPLALNLQRLLFEEKIIGNIRRVHADHGQVFDLEDTKSRLLDPNLGGGALLDLGIYNLTWIRMICSADPRNGGVQPEVVASMLKTENTGVDEQTSIALNFPGSRVQATMQCNMVIQSSEENIVLIQGDKGDITVQWPPYRPTSFTVYKRSNSIRADSKPRSDAASRVTHYFDIPASGHGMFWEADECARCLRDRRMESSRMPWSESIATMTIMDQARSQNSFRYPESLERAD